MKIILLAYFLFMALANTYSQTSEDMGFLDGIYSISTESSMLNDSLNSLSKQSYQIALEDEYYFFQKVKTEFKADSIIFSGKIGGLFNVFNPSSGKYELIFNNCAPIITFRKHKNDKIWYGKYASEETGECDAQMYFSNESLVIAGVSAKSIIFYNHYTVIEPKNKIKKLIRKNL